MNTKQQLEKTFGTVETSGWVKDAQKRRDNKGLAYSQQIALLILEHIDKAGISQKKLAQQLQVQPQLVNKWLSGKVNFTLETIARIEHELGINLIQVGNYSARKERVDVWLSTIGGEKYQHYPISKLPSFKQPPRVVQMHHQPYSLEHYGN